MLFHLNFERVQAIDELWILLEDRPVEVSHEKSLKRNLFKTP